MKIVGKALILSTNFISLQGGQYQQKDLEASVFVRTRDKAS